VVPVMVNSNYLRKLQIILLLPIFICTWLSMSFCFNDQGKYLLQSKIAILKAKAVISSFAAKKKPNIPVYNLALSKSETSFDLSSAYTSVTTGSPFLTPQYLLTISNKSPPVQA